MKPVTPEGPWWRRIEFPLGSRPAGGEWTVFTPLLLLRHKNLAEVKCESFFFSVL